MLTTTKTAALLGIGKPRLYKLIDKLGLEPVEQGRSKLITPEMLEIIQNELGEQVVSNDAESIQNDAASLRNDTESIRNDSRTMEVLEKQVTHLQKMLEDERALLLHEQDERKAERQERENYQQMLAALQQNNQKLLQENNRLQLELLEAPKQSKFDVDSAADDVEDSVDISTPTPATSTAQPMEYTPKRGSSWGLGIGLGAVAAAIIFYVLISDQGAKFFPQIQQKLVGALHLSDTNSIVPYRFDENGGLR
jgi:hypothetical protein